VQDDPKLEALLRWRAQDLRALRRLRGRKVLLTNAQRGYTTRVLKAMGLSNYFERVLCFQDQYFAEQPRPKPDLRSLRMLCAQLKVHPSQCGFVEDTAGHLKRAQKLGTRNVLMQGFSPLARAKRGRAPYLYAKIKAIQDLVRLP
jgi:putative hydrolase of the HAD superfamily